MCKRFQRVALLPLLLALGLALWVGCASTPQPDPATGAAAGPFLDAFVGDEEEQGAYGGGVAFDAMYSPEEFFALNGRSRGKIPPPPFPMKDPAIVVSLKGLTCRVFDRSGEGERVYPVGVGVREMTNQLSITPVGRFSTLQNAQNDWYYIWERRIPGYFAGLPFLRINALNEEGFHTYGLHGPITEELIRGYVSHGCVRMRGDDIRELFTFAYSSPGTKVIIQDEADYNRYGLLYDVAFPRGDEPLAQLPRVKMHEVADISVEFDLPQSVPVGQQLVVEARVTGPDAAKVRYVLFNEEGVWDANLGEPREVSAARESVNFDSAGQRTIYAIALDEEQNPIGFTQKEISIH